MQVTQNVMFNKSLEAFSTLRNSKFSQDIGLRFILKIRRSFIHKC
jgi:hypothetical protein